MYNMTITVATRKDIAQWILSNKGICTSVNDLEIAKIESESSIGVGAVRVFLDKNDDKYTCFCEDDEVHYDEVDINLNEEDITPETCNYIKFEAIFNYVIEHITKEFA